MPHRQSSSSHTQLSFNQFNIMQLSFNQFNIMQLSFNQFNNMYAFHFAAQESITSHSVFAFMIPVLLNFLQIKSSTKDSSPFELHPVITMISFGCLIAYYLAFSAKFFFPAYTSPFGNAMSLFGSLSVTFLACLILPDPWWCSILFILMMAGGLFKLLQKSYRMHGLGLRTRQAPLLPIHTRDIEGF